jgi:hypothetical protein
MPREFPSEAFIHPIYEKYFPRNRPAPIDWQPFNKYQAMRKDFSECDFIVKREADWSSRAKTIALIVLKIILLPWGLYEAIKGLIGRIAMLAIYPAQHFFTDKQLTEQRIWLENAFQDAPGREFIKREVVLEKEGQKYTGVLFGHERNIHNGKWALFAPGNCMTIEQQMEKNIWPYLNAGFNVLLVNGPGVGKSQGMATMNRIGDAQEVGIRFLEEALKAQKIVMAGYSLGGAAIGLAALKHDFNPDVHYLALRIMSFDKLSSLAEKIQSPIAGKAIRWFDCEMDSIASSKKFQEHGIHEVVIQAEKDEIMNPSSLLDGLQREGLMGNKTGIIIPNATHRNLPGDVITAQIQRWDRAIAPAIAV